MGNQTNRPIQKFRCQNIEAAIWENKRKLDNNTEVNFKTVSLTRSYRKKGEDLWRSDVIHLRRNDLQKAILVLRKAQEELLMSSSGKESEEDEEE